MLALVALLAVAAAGCAGPAFRPFAPSAAALRARADAAIRDGDLPLAYRELARLHTLHPGSPEDTEAFPLAAQVLRRLFWKYRFAEPDSVWVTSEPEFMFRWAAQYFEGDAFPQKQMESLLRGMPLSFAQRFLAYAAEEPQIARWTIRVQEDDGLVREVEARPATARVPAER